jgi:2'-5' RNA ligase
MRLFVSINLGDELNNYLAGLQGELGKAAGVRSDGVRSDGARSDGARLSLAGRKSGFHLTLFFLGEVSVEKVLDLQKELRGISFEPFKLKFREKLGVFKGGGFIKAAFVDIDRECDGFVRLLNLQKKVAEAVVKFGFGGAMNGRGGIGSESGGGRVFSPHITLARVGFCPREIAADFEKAVLGLEVSDREFDVDEFYLMESHLGVGGSVYEEMFRIRSF